MSMYVCLSARLSRKPHFRSSPNFLSTLPVAVGRSNSDRFAISYVFPVLWMTSCFNSVGRKGQNEAARRYISIQFARWRHQLDVNRPVHAWSTFVRTGGKSVIYNWPVCDVWEYSVDTFSSSSGRPRTIPCWPGWNSGHCWSSPCRRSRRSSRWACRQWHSRGTRAVLAPSPYQYNYNELKNLSSPIDMHTHAGRQRIDNSVTF